MLRFFSVFLATQSTSLGSALRLASVCIGPVFCCSAVLHLFRVEVSRLVSNTKILPAGAPVWVMPYAAEQKAFV